MASPMQLMPLQWSPSVHGLPSLQLAVGFGVWVQPVLGLQLSTVQGLPSSQSSAVPVQPEVPQVSFSVHRSLSLHGMLLAGVWIHTPPVQPSTVHTSPSLQLSPAVAVHCPALQALADEHGLLSSQVVPSVLAA